MKKTWVRKTLSVGVLAAGALLLAPAASALADTDQVTTGNFGTLNGTQVAVPVTVPVNLVGNSAGILGSAQSFGVGANQVENGRDGGGTRQVSAQNRGFLNGTQVAVPVTVPVNVSGNAAAVAGKASATGVSANRVESSKITENGWGGAGGGSTDQVTFGNFGTLNGTQVAMPVTVPVNACGNSLALLGSAGSTGICANQVGGGGGGSYARKAVQPLESKTKKAAAKRTENVSCFVAFDPCGSQGSWVWPAAAANQASFGNYGTLNGSQFAAPITVPVNACGNSLGVLGYASAHGVCSNNVGGAYAEPVRWAKPVVPAVPVVPVYPAPSYVAADDHCVRICDDDDVRGDQAGYPNGDDVRGDNDGYTNDDDVRGDNGYNDDDVAPDNAGYDKGGNRDDADEAPADVKGANDAGYVKGDKYTKGGGRTTEESATAGLTRTVGGLGGLDLLSTLR